MPRSLAHATVVHGRYDIRILYKQCASLAKQGNAVTLWVADALGDEVVEGVAIRSLGQPRFGRLGRAVMGNIALWRAVRRTRPDILHLHDPELLPLGYLLLLGGTRVVFDMHENLPKEILTKHWIRRPLRRALSSVVRVVQTRLSARVPTVFAERSYAADFPHARAGVSVLNFPLVGALVGLERPKEPRFTIGYIGGVSRGRGALAITAAVAELQSRGVDVGATLVGPVSADVQSSAAFSEAVSRGWIRTTGRLRPGEGWPLMAACHVGVALLDDEPNFVDSYPTKVFEYMALGLPVLVSDFPLWREVVDGAECGLLVNPASVAEIVDALLWLAAHPDEASAMGMRGRAAVQRNYSWDSEFAKLANLYDGLLSA